MKNVIRLSREEYSSLRVYQKAYYCKSLKDALRHAVRKITLQHRDLATGRASEGENSSYSYHRQDTISMKYAEDITDAVIRKALRDGEVGNEPYDFDIDSCLLDIERFLLEGDRVALMTAYVRLRDGYLFTKPHPPQTYPDAMQ